MTRRRTSALVAAALLLTGLATLLAVWRPWDPVPDELRAAERQIERVPGVVDATADYAVAGSAHLGVVVARSTMTVRLDDALDADEAGRAAGKAAGVVEDVAVPGTELATSLEVEVGKPRSFGGLPVPPVSVSVPVRDEIQGGTAASLSEDAAPGAARRATDAVASAVTLRDGGAVRVGTATADAADADGLPGLASLAARESLPVSLGTADGTVTYDSYGAVPDVAAVGLAARTSGRGGVAHTAFAASTAPRLTVALAVPTSSPEARELVRWLEDPARASGLAGPVAYSLAEPGYATMLDGWVGDAAPPKPAEHATPVPGDVVPWPADDRAPGCTADDLRLTLGPPDAAAGSRYLAVHAENVSGRPCALDGVPDLVFRDADGAPQEVTVEPSDPGVVPARVVVPPGERALATVQWRAMSTANDPDVTTAVDVVPVPDAHPARLTSRDPDGGGPAELDVLDGATVRVSPWVQGAEGWS
ncbi:MULTISPECIES: DUF4232 domain-containing protein [unclassified Isoptericola]|uniref:DUF4232 domain-containing protein n=1 Tax=unclassified Isoptericola TaxID=2623355 RepID=UPI003666D50C